MGGWVSWLFGDSSSQEGASVRRHRKRKCASPYGAGRPRRFRPGTDDNSALPEQAGEYRIRGAKGIEYVGETRNLKRRINEHRRSGKLGPRECVDYKVADGRSTSTTRRKHEKRSIRKHSPGRNKRNGGGGRR